MITDLEDFKFRKEAAPYETRTNQIRALADRIGEMLPRDWDAKDGALVLAHAWLNAVGNDKNRVMAAVHLVTQMLLYAPDEEQQSHGSQPE